jgi:hypothetical protein
MPTISFNLNRTINSSGANIVFALGLTVADYSCAAIVTQTSQIAMSARAYQRLNLPPTGATWDYSKRNDLVTSAKWKISNRLDSHMFLNWNKAALIDSSFFIKWNRTQRLDKPSTSIIWQIAQKLDISNNVVKWNALSAKDSANTIVKWEILNNFDVSPISVKWREPSPIERVSSILWGRAQPVDIIASLAHQEGPINDSDPIAIPWNAARPVVDYLVPSFPNPGESELPPYELQKGRGFACFHLGKNRQSNFNIYALNRRLNNDQCFAGAFIVNNTYSAKTLHDNLALELLSFSANSDVGSTAWDFTIGVPRLTELNRLKPTASGPIEIEIVVNGYTYRGVVDSYDESRSLGSWGYSATARGLTAYAAAPYAANKTAVLPNVFKSSSLLANEAVASLGGFTVNWLTYNYIVQPNQLSYSDKDAVGVVSQLANAIGAIVIPHRYNKEFTVSSRYPISPWDWSLPATPITQVISKNLMLRVSGRYLPATKFNKVYVTATQSGYNAGIKRAGTAGDSLAPQITEALLTQPVTGFTALGNIERGRVELAKSGPRRNQTVITPLVAANVTPGVRLRELLDIVELEDDEGFYRAMVTKVGVTMTTEATGLLKVYQTLECERYA